MMRLLETRSRPYSSKNVSGAAYLSFQSCVKAVKMSKKKTGRSRFISARASLQKGQASPPPRHLLAPPAGYSQRRMIRDLRHTGTADPSPGSMIGAGVPGTGNMLLWLSSTRSGGRAHQPLGVSGHRPAQPTAAQKPAWLRPFPQQHSLLATGVASLRLHRRPQLFLLLGRPGRRRRAWRAPHRNWPRRNLSKLTAAASLPSASGWPIPCRALAAVCLSPADSLRCAPRPLPADQTVARHPVAGRRWQGVVEP